MTRETLFMKAINEGLDQAMERDERVVLLGEDIAGGVNVEHLENNNEDAWGGVMGITRGLMPKYGRERVIDTPISEHGYLSASVGMALTGLRPVPELMFNDFIGFCFDALLGQASKMRYMFGGKAKVPMVVRTMHGAGASAAAEKRPEPASAPAAGPFPVYPGASPKADAPLSEGRRCSNSHERLS